MRVLQKQGYLLYEEFFYVVYGYGNRNISVKFSIGYVGLAGKSLGL